MPKKVFVIEWDYPDEEFWLNAESIENMLDNHCANTKFKVTELVPEDVPIFPEEG